MIKFLQNIFLLILSLTITFISLEVCFRFYSSYLDKQVGSIDDLKASTKAHSAYKMNLGKTNKLASLINKSKYQNVVYELKPNVYANFLNQDVVVNNWGGRSAVDFPSSKKENEYRVIGIGDSIMFGWGAAEKDTYLKVVEKNLNKTQLVNLRNINFEFLNFGTPGYNTAMEVELFANKLFMLKPDAVVIHIVGNDLSLPRFMELKTNYWNFEKSFLWETLKGRFLTLFNSKNSSALATPLKNPNLLDIQEGFSRRKDRYQVQNPYTWMASLGGFEKSLKKLRKLSEENNFKLYFLVSTSSKQILRSINKVAKNSQIKIVEVGSYVEKFFTENYSKATKEERFKIITIGNNDPHPNKLGHGIYAEALFDSISKSF